MNSEVAGPPSAAVPLIRAQPEDFVVDEIPLYPPTGEGAHTFVRIRKRLRNTEQVARDLARAAGVRPRDVGYAGRKDRLAVTTQWFSVPELAPTDALALRLPCAEVLEAVRHPHKLRTGQLRGNRFEIRVREVEPEVRQRAEARLETLRQRGFPNRFGSQRFGRGGLNPERARALLSDPGRAARVDRRQTRFLISALQSAAFNEVLRLRPTPLDRVEAGEVAVVHASGGAFIVEDVDRENERAAGFEISATGPMFGTRCLQPTGAVREREDAALAALGVPDLTQLRPPAGIRLRGARRSVRARPEELKLEFGERELRLSVQLPPGSYVTVLLEEWIGELRSVPDDTPSS